MTTNFIVLVEDNNVEWALKKLKRLYMLTGLSKEMKRRSYYEKPSVKKRRKQKVARAKALKATNRRVYADTR